MIVGRDADGTDLAVALVYDRANGRAPLVLVSGRGPAADRIQQASTRTRTRTVSVHFDDALAAALVHLPAGQEIPESCFERVAALLRPLLSPSGRVEGPVATP